MFLKEPFISILLVGSMMAILTAGCGRSGQAAGADISAATTTAATTKTTGTTATNRTADPSSAAATTEQTLSRPTSKRLSGPRAGVGPPTVTTAIRTTTLSFHKIRPTRSLSPSIPRTGPRCRQIWWSCLARPALAAGGVGQASPAAAETVSHLRVAACGRQGASRRRKVRRPHRGCSPRQGVKATRRLNATA